MNKVLGFIYSLILTVLIFSGCSFKSAQFDSVRSSEFRYKNTQNQTVFLPLNTKICIQNKQNTLPKATQALNNFIQKEWKENALFENNCANSDFALTLYTTFDYYGVIFKALKLNIIEQQTQKVVANYTLYSTKEEREHLDNETTIDAFAPLFLNHTRIFNN